MLGQYLPASLLTELLSEFPVSADLLRDQFVCIPFLSVPVKFDGEHGNPANRNVAKFLSVPVKFDGVLMAVFC